MRHRHSQIRVPDRSHEGVYEAEAATESCAVPGVFGSRREVASRLNEMSSRRDEVLPQALNQLTAP